MKVKSDPPALTPPLRLRVGVYDVAIATLDDALAFAETNPFPKGDYEGMIRRLQGAHSTEEMVEAANAFSWWAQSNGLVATSGGPD